MDNGLKRHIEDIWNETLPHWQDQKSQEYYDHCITVLIAYIDQLTMNNANIEAICENTISNRYR